MIPTPSRASPRSSRSEARYAEACGFRPSFSATRPSGPRSDDADDPRYLGLYHLLEDMRRYNAAYQEQEPAIYAWVAHIGCCGGPEADYEAETGAR